MVRILQVGSKKPDLHVVALKIFTICIHNQIQLEPEWIPRELNEKADYLSRIVDLDDWLLNPIIFHSVDKAWGLHTVDRFAEFHNKQTPIGSRVARCWNPGTEAVDAFVVDWYYHWWCPPIWLVPSVISHAQVCKAVGTLIVPCWPSAQFWPLIHLTIEEFAPFVTVVEELPLSDDTIIPGLSGASLFKGSMPNVKLLALRCKFIGPDRLYTDTTVE